MGFIKVSDAQGATHVLEALEGCRAMARMTDSLRVAKAISRQPYGPEATLPGA